MTPRPVKAISKHQSPSYWWGSLPNGSLARNRDHYINVWRSYGVAVCSRLSGNTRAIAYDPGFILLFEDGHTEDISGYLANAIIEGSQPHV